MTQVALTRAARADIDEIWATLRWKRATLPQLTK
jgi:plasmid stabilization system protein ParE